jgi:hypothetical protein
MAGPALQRGVEIVKKLGLAARYNFQINENDLADQQASASLNTSAASRTQTDPGKCFIG